MKKISKILLVLFVPASIVLLSFAWEKAKIAHDCQEGVHNFNQWHLNQ